MIFEFSVPDRDGGTPRRDPLLPFCIEKFHIQKGISVAFVPFQAEDELLLSRGILIEIGERDCVVLFCGVFQRHGKSAAAVARDRGFPVVSVSENLEAQWILLLCFLPERTPRFRKQRKSESERRQSRQKNS